MATRKPIAELKFKCRLFEFNMKNTPRLAFIIVSIGLCFLLVLFGMWLYSGEDSYKERVAHIEKKIINDEPLSKDDEDFLKTLTSEERKKLDRNIRLRIGDKFKMEQNLAPGTEVKVRHTKNGDVEIRKGGVSE